MSITSTHPEYQRYAGEWTMLRDCYDGEGKVKSRSTVYLPTTKGMQIDGMLPGQLGYEVYQSYITRAVFPDYVREAVETYIGHLWQKIPTIQLPPQMEPLREHATIHGESLSSLLRRIHEEQLLVGRCGLLLDLPTEAGPDALPYLALYQTEGIVNWDDSEADEGQHRLNLVVLNESGYVRNGFEWEVQEKYRVLQLGDLRQNEMRGPYLQGVFVSTGDGASYSEDAMWPPMYRGVALDFIPFTFINVKDITAKPDVPPLIGLARQALTIYRGEGDYRQNLFMQGQDTLVISGGYRRSDLSTSDKPVRTGAGSLLELEAGSDAKYIGVSSIGLPEQRLALIEDRKRAEELAGRMLDVGRHNAESASALQTRVSAQTASLKQIALTAAQGLEKALRDCARWMGLDPKQVNVIPNTEFATYHMGGQELSHFMDAKAKGAPISQKTIHDMLVNRGIAKVDFETELKLIALDPKIEPVLPSPSREDSEQPPERGNRMSGEE